MQVKFDLQIGKSTFTIVEEVNSNVDFFKKLSFYADLPKVGPNGEDDLKLVYRNPKGYEYYSIVSEKAQMELKFGQLKDPEGALFMKEWEPLYKPEQGAQNVQPTGGLGAPVAAAPQPAAAAPTPAAGLGATAPVQTAPTQPASPQVTQAAASILDKFGIGG